MTAGNKDLKGWAFVKNVANEQEAVLVESVLDIEKIPVLKKHREAGSYLEIYMGMSRYGIDIYVPENALELAKGLLESEMIDMPEETGAEEVEKDAGKYEVKRRSIVWVILGYLFLPVIAAIIWRIFVR
ncbi:MAG: hypothetical protein VB106_16220 [Clostridiaceae bacterium]|nr:hypothetical protein [Clostridiaceae bacterium]